MTPQERFDSKWEYRAPFTCWFWTKGKNNGYGQFSVGYKNNVAHKWAYEQKYGPVPKGLHLDHFVCDTPGCANPDHVRPVFIRENLLRGRTLASINLAKTHCPRGHDYNEANTYIHPTGRRYCRACARQRWHDGKS